MPVDFGLRQGRLGDKSMEGIIVPMGRKDRLAGKGKVSGSNIRMRMPKALADGIGRQEFYGTRRFVRGFFGAWIYFFGTSCSGKPTRSKVFLDSSALRSK